MTIEQFIKQIQDYYGAYNATQKIAVCKWLDGKNGRAISLLHAEILKAVSAMYKRPPAVKELEDAWKEVLDHRGFELDAPPEQKQIEEKPMERVELKKVLDDITAKLAKAKTYRRKK